MKFTTLKNYKLILFFLLFKISNSANTNSNTNRPQDFSSSNSTETALTAAAKIYEINLNKTTNKISLIFDENTNQYTEENKNKLKIRNDEESQNSKALDQLVEKNTKKIKDAINSKSKNNEKNLENSLNKNPKISIPPQKNKYSEAIKSLKKLNSKIGNPREKIKFSKKDILANLRGDINFQKFKKLAKGNKKDEILLEEFLKMKNPKKKKYMEDDNIFMFYNSLSLIMLSMLGGGVVGVIFILYFSFKSDDTNSYN